MGKPFRKEIQESASTISWALNQEVEELKKRIFANPSRPLLIVGSGGSLSACHYAASLYQNLGYVAKAITPLDLYYSRFTLGNAKILFISSSGRNNDILFAFKIAIQNHANDITTVCMRKDSPLSKLADSYSVSTAIEYDIPTKKDGFLATNSLTAFFVLLSKAARSQSLEPVNIDEDFNNKIDQFVSKFQQDSSITVLYGGWSTAVAFDIESKFTEAALGNVLLTDYRNFGHGRHHWFAKRKRNSSIIALVTPEEKMIAEKTMSFIPKDIPKLIIESPKVGAASAIELLIKSYHLVNRVGEEMGIDPGRPGVPEFGSKLYHLKYSTFYRNRSTEKIGTIEENAILKKAHKTSLIQFQPEELAYWRSKFSAFMKRLKLAQFGSVVFDYDGTLCSADNRYKNSLPSEVSNELVKLLEAGFIVGIATGRGQSVRTALQNSIKKKSLWKNVIIGYYNGSDISTLDDDSAPNISDGHNKQLGEVEKHVAELKTIWKDLDLKLRPNQLTIETKEHSTWVPVRRIIQNMIMTSNYSDLQLLESSHSLDVVVRKKASKVNVVNFCVHRSKILGLKSECLTIGDKGQWPGNDFELLSSPYSLSVDEVSSSPETCWSLTNNGISGFEGLLQYLQALKISKEYFSFSE
jgi:HAD superfamily hydrolase (TIGR01484 family)